MARVYYIVEAFHCVSDVNTLTFKMASFDPDHALAIILQARFNEEAKKAREEGKKAREKEKVFLSLDILFTEIQKPLRFSRLSFVNKQYI